MAPSFDFFQSKNKYGNKNMVAISLTEDLNLVFIHSWEHFYKAHLLKSSEKLEFRSKCLLSFSSSLGLEKCPFELKYYTEAVLRELTKSRGNKIWTFLSFHLKFHFSSGLIFGLKYLQILKQEDQIVFGGCC